MKRPSAREARRIWRARDQSSRPQSANRPLLGRALAEAKKNCAPPLKLSASFFYFSAAGRQRLGPV